MTCPDPVPAARLEAQHNALTCSRAVLRSTAIRAFPL